MSNIVGSIHFRLPWVIIQDGGGTHERGIQSENGNNLRNNGGDKLCLDIGKHQFIYSFDPIDSDIPFCTTYSATGSAVELCVQGMQLSFMDILIPFIDSYQTYEIVREFFLFFLPSFLRRWTQTGAQNLVP